MLDIKFVREHLEEVKEKVGRRGQAINWELFTQADSQRRQVLQESESLRAQRNQVSDVIAEKKKKKQDASVEITQMKEVSARIKDLETKLAEKEEALRQLMMVIPNIPHESVLIGKGEADNLEVRRWGKLPEFSFPPRPHWEIGEALDILDFERGAKITGARFTLYKDLGARMERALMNFMLDLHIGPHGYREVLPPFMVNRKAMTGTGQLPKFEEDAFKTTTTPPLYLIPTAEVPVTNMHRDEVLEADALPIWYCASTPCFRAEAGSAGRDTRGIIRQHQFHKVELVKFTRAEESYAEHDRMMDDACEVLRRLGLHHRVVLLCAGDMGFSAAKTYDVEVWCPGQDSYREISSVSNCEDFQARRIRVRYRGEGGKPRLAHTLNGSGVAVGRTVVAILEQYQEADGTVTVPEALRPYMGGMERIVPERFPRGVER